MRNLNALICFGTRPEAIKMAPVIMELRQQQVSFKVCVTAQHREMLDQVLKFFQIKPDYDLDIMRENQTLNNLSSKIFTGIDEVIVKEKPDVVLVQGDTTSATMVALAAFHRGVKVGHIEAGLRTFNKLSPFPEEINRQIIARIADFHFAPTNKAREHLLEERIMEERIFITGNTVVDAVQWARVQISTLRESEEIKKIKDLIQPNKKLILVTLHRRENFGKGLLQICEALKILATRNDVEIVYPVHPNPNVSKPVFELLSLEKNIHLLQPVSYPTMLWLESGSDLIISDSGGIQEEAPAFKKPVLVTRDYSERMEGVDAGFCTLTGTQKEIIIREAVNILNNPPDLSSIENPYGDGMAGKKIVEILMRD